MDTTDRRTITRVLLRNYKSIAACAVELHPLTLLVGPNGGGKSNFLDALRFVSQSLQFPMEHAIRERGGIREVRRRSRGHPNHFRLRLDLRLDHGSASYGFTVGARSGGRFRIRQEECRVRSTDPAKAGHFMVRDGQLADAFTSGLAPASGPERLYLPAASSHPVLLPVYEALSRMAFYNLEPRRIRELQDSAPGNLLDHDGGNIASVFGALKADSPDRAERVVRYISTIVPGIERVATKALGPKLTLEFGQQVRGDRHASGFLAGGMSDGTLRAFGVLVALFQNGASRPTSGRVVGIEEPELALHPAAAEALLDVMLEASEETQVLATTHSADLLDQEELPPESLLAVVMEDGETKLAPLDAKGRQTLGQGLSSPGDLLRMELLRPDPAIASPSPGSLFREPR